MRLLIAGAGGHGRVVAETSTRIGSFSEIAFVDDRLSGSVAEGWPVVGKTSDLRRLRDSFDCFVAAIGDADVRMKYLRVAAEIGYKIQTVIDPSAITSRFSTIGHGTAVIAGAIINAGCEIDVGCIINTGATVDHDCVLGVGVHICPGVHLAGNVRVGSCSWIGIGAVAKQGVSIGSRVTVGAGAVVIGDIPDYATVVGNPARPLNRNR